MEQIVFVPAFSLFDDSWKSREVKTKNALARFILAQGQIRR
jgi:hypothetical protein